MKARYLMATEAHHKLGDISRDEPDYIWATSEDAENYYGNWCAGLGFVNVRFPKHTTREMTVAEAERVANANWVIV